MGNIAAALQGYAFGRYGFDLDTLWSRLLLVLQRVDQSERQRNLRAHHGQGGVLNCDHIHHGV